MMCFKFYFGDKEEEPKTSKWVSDQSNNSTLTDQEMKRFASELSSQNVSNVSTESLVRPTFPSLSQRASNLRMFTFSELKSITKNFSRSTMIGEGGFGCVYKGLLKSSEDPPTKLDVAVKQLGKRGMQVSFLEIFFFLCFHYHRFGIGSTFLSFFLNLYMAYHLIIRVTIATYI